MLSDIFTTNANFNNQVDGRRTKTKLKTNPLLISDENLFLIKILISVNFEYLNGREHTSGFTVNLTAVWKIQLKCDWVKGASLNDFREAMLHNLRQMNVQVINWSNIYQML